MEADDPAAIRNGFPVRASGRNATAMAGESRRPNARKPPGRLL